MNTQPWNGETGTRPAPYRPRTGEADVIVPTAQAAIIALAVGLLVAVGLGVLCVVGELDAVRVVGFPALAFVFVGLVVFLALAWRGFALRRLLWLAEAGIGVDLDGDGVRGRPERREPIIIHALGASRGGDVGENPDVDALRPAVGDGRSDLYAFLLRCYTVGVSRSSWLGSGVPRFRLPSGERVTRSVYDGYMGILDAAGIATNENGSGWSLAVDVGEAMGACGLVGLWTTDGRPGDGQAGGQPGGRATGDGSRAGLQGVGK